MKESNENPGIDKPKSNQVELIKQKAINSFNKKNGLDEDTNGVEMKESEPGNDSSTNLTNLTNFKPIEINNSSLSSK